MKRHYFTFTSTVVVVVLCIIIFIFVALGRPPRDDSDPANGRSGMDVLTDNLTGCQYLSRRNAGITPRLDKTGKQICLTDLNSN